MKIIRSNSLVFQMIIFFICRHPLCLGEEFLSPRLSKLAEEIAYDEEKALQRFEEELLVQGGPLIESIPGDDSNLWVTFLSFENEKSDPLVAGKFNANQEIYFPLKAFLHTNIYFRTFKCANDLRTIYIFCQKDLSKPTKTDPLNPKKLTLKRFESLNRTLSCTYSILELPQAPDQSYLEERQNVPHGQIAEHLFKSPLLGNERKIWIYTPDDYDANNRSYPLILLFDGQYLTSMYEISNALNNVIHDKLIPPAIVVMIDSINDQLRSTELPSYQPFLDCLTKEIMPWIQQNYPVTSSPSQTIIGGASFGGLAAMHCGLYYPHLFGKVLSLSGAFWFSPEQQHRGFFGDIIRKFIGFSKMPLKLYLEVGNLETSPWTNSNRLMRHTLIHKGYEHHYNEYSGEHYHVNWRGSLISGLIYLMNDNVSENF